MGCGFVPAGSYLDVFAVVEANSRYLTARSGALAIWKELTVPNIRATYPIIRDTVREVGASAVVSHLACFGGSWAAAETKVRSVSVTTSSSAWLSRYQPAAFGNWRAPRIVQSAL